ncbi:AlwI restriction endonuclease [Methanolobus tindarius DSM 2278]|uniref:AlwI restriction endonuclease n=1 Tax=Methanolobus tindarius DSM 2278 TaxID=1090322 RepID=W9DQ35_METTI|nr:restriction endonuclease [Methanolobus tindarius]ETA67508.1 AlwI restriction endonuclease [Methanolobus tindarius DSM 2278]
MVSVSLNDAAWQKVFDHFEIEKQLDENGCAYVTAVDMKSIGGREPRLMAKHDTMESRPQIFKRNKCVIFPVINGKYIIFRDRKPYSYYKFQSLLDDLPVEEYQTQIDISKFDSFSQSKEFSESQAIDYAYVISLLKNFTGEQDLFLTIRGRYRSADFDFILPEQDHQVNVSGVQIEVDSGYESFDKIYLIEVKVGKRDDFHIRQLYYPYRDWITKSDKEIIPIFFLYTNGLFYLTEFKFGEKFGETTIVRKRCFVVNDTPTLDVRIDSLLKSVRIEDEPVLVPYPQADDLDKVIDVVANIENGYNTKESISLYFDFHERQADYYGNAAIYLGLIERSESSAGRFHLTEFGNKLLNASSRSERNDLLLRQLLKKATFNEIFMQLYQDDFDEDVLNKTFVSSVIRKHTPLTGTTPDRRASTVISWFKWMLKNISFE